MIAVIWYYLAIIVRIIYSPTRILCFISLESFENTQFLKLQLMTYIDSTPNWRLNFQFKLRICWYLRVLSTNLPMDLCFECRMSFPKWIGNHSRYLHWWISLATAPMTWSSKLPQRYPITHVAHASFQAAMFVTWNIKNVFAQKAWKVLNAPNVPNFIIVILEDAKNVQDMVLRQVPVGDEEYVKMRWTRLTRNMSRWVPTATLATEISDPLVIALLLAFVDVFHHLLVLDARNSDVRILKTRFFDLQKVFKKLSEFLWWFDVSSKHLRFTFCKAARGDPLVSVFSVTCCEEGQCPSGQFLHTDADISLRSIWYPQWQACMPCTPGSFKPPLPLYKIPRFHSKTLNDNKLHWSWLMMFVKSRISRCFLVPIGSIILFSRKSVEKVSWLDWACACRAFQRRQWKRAMQWLWSRAISKQIGPDCMLFVLTRPVLCHLCFLALFLKLKGLLTQLEKSVAKGSFTKHVP